MIRYYSGQSAAVCGIFHEAVHQTAHQRYTREQLAAWAPADRDYDMWRWRCEVKRPFLFVRAGRIAGFIEFDETGRIDCLYTHPTCNRQGIGSCLLAHVIDIARHRGMTRIFTAASHAAKGLFLKHGFRTVRKNDVVCRGITMGSWIMERALPGSGPGTGLGEPAMAGDGGVDRVSAR